MEGDSLVTVEKLDFYPEIELNERLSELAAGSKLKRRRKFIPRSPPVD